MRVWTVLPRRFGAIETRDIDREKDGSDRLASDGLRDGAGMVVSCCKAQEAG